MNSSKLSKKKLSSSQNLSKNRIWGTLLTSLLLGMTPKFYYDTQVRPDFTRVIQAKSVTFIVQKSIYNMSS